MNIGIFTDTYSPQVNGVVSSILTLEKELIKLGHHVYIFTPTHPHATHDKNYVFRCPSLPFIFVKDHRMSAFYSTKMLAKIKGLKLNIIACQTEFSMGIFARIVARRLNLPIVHTYHTIYEHYTHYISKGLLVSPDIARKYSRHFCNHVDSIIAPSAKTQSLLLNYGVNKPIEVIPSGIDLSGFKAHYDLTNLYTEYNLSPSTPTVLFIGRLAKEKSIDIIFYSLQHLLKKSPDAKLLIIGDGPERKHLVTLANKLSISSSVIFFGAKPWHDIAKYYKLGNVFVSASTSETQGLTFIEAMASSVPVVAKFDPCIKDIIVHGENGYFFNHLDELTQTLHHLLSKESLRYKIQRNALECVTYFSSEYFAKSILSHYNTTIETFYKSKVS